MGVLSKDQIVSADDAGRELVSVPEWGGDVYIKVMSGTERDNFESWCSKSSKREDMTNLRAKLLSLCLVNEAGVRLFSDNEMQALGSKSGIVLNRLYHAARAVNCYDQKDVEELEKNS